MIRTRFTELVGCTVPIQQAAMGVASPPELVAAVSEAGALGMLGMGRPGVTMETMPKLLDDVRARTDRPFGVNFIVAPLYLNGRGGHDPRPPLDQRLIELAGERAQVVEFFYGWPQGDLVELAHRGGALVSWQVGSREEAVAAVGAGADLLVAQGIEAGGHVRSTIGLHALLAEVLEAVDRPVLAAGGIGDGRAMAAALAAGADGVRVGTRFVAAEESGAHPRYVEALIRARAQDTVYTEAFGVVWRDAPHRVLRSSIAACEAFEGNVVGEMASLTGARIPVTRWGGYTPARDTTGAIDAMAMWAGESVGAVRRVQPAAEIVNELASEAERLLGRRG